jgi:hypothetical protein
MGVGEGIRALNFAHGRAGSIDRSLRHRGLYGKLAGRCKIAFSQMGEQIDFDLVSNGTAEPIVQAVLARIPDRRRGRRDFRKWVFEPDGTRASFSIVVRAGIQQRHRPVHVNMMVTQGAKETLVSKFVEDAMKVSS